MQPKKITQSTLVGELGVNLIARITMEMGFAWHSRGTVDAGIDGEIELRDNKTGEAFNSVIGVQSKATDRPLANETDFGFDFYCDPRDIDYWTKGNLPVLLIVSRPFKGEAYWVSVKDYFANPLRRSDRKIHFDKKRDRFDVKCRESVFELAMPKSAGVYLSPPNKTERLISNLLPVTQLADTIYVGHTDFVRPAEVWQRGRATGQIGSEWVFRNKAITSFHDLPSLAWTGICEQGSVDEFGTDEWAFTDDADRLRDFVELLSRTLRAKLAVDLDYSAPLDMFYFRASSDLSERQVAYQSLLSATDRTVFKAYAAEDGTVKYYRHSAFEHRFRRFDNRWFLQVSPTYYFTSDGYHLRPNHGVFLKRIKEFEGHEAVRGQLIMWAALLSRRADMFADPYPFMGFGTPLEFQVEQGIDDAKWKMRRELADAVAEEIDDDSELLQMQFRFEES